MNTYLRVVGVESGQVRIERGVSEVERRVLEIRSQINVSWH